MGYGPHYAGSLKRVSLPFAADNSPQVDPTVPMKFEELLVLLPCHSFEDFPIHNEGEEAEGLLAAWSGLWHPAFIASAGKIPTYCRADSPPDALANRMLVVPSASAKEMPVGFPARAKEGGACLLRKFTKRQELVAAGLAELDGGDEAKNLDENLVSDFLALGYCYLQTELLTRRMRYMSVLDGPHFQNQCVAGAEAVLNNDAATAKDKLTSCFSLLAEARAHFYPVDAYLVDLTLVAATTIGESLRKALSRPVPTNLLVTGETVELMARDQPETLAILKDALEKGHVNLAGGEYGERDIPLLSCETLRVELEKGLATYQKYLDRRPEVWGRRKYGPTAALPGVLNKLGFIGALHFALDDGRFPQSERSKTRWEGIDGSAIDAIGRVPFDANDPKTFLSLSDKMGHTMDADHVATLVFAHWPGQVCEYYDDLRRMAAYAPALGRFIALNEYFRTTDTAGTMNRFDPDAYRSPYLQQAIIRKTPDPLSASVTYYQQQVAECCAKGLQTLADLMRGKACDADLRNDCQTKAALDAFAVALPRDKTPAQPGMLLTNPTLSTRRIGVDVSALPRLPAVDGPVKSAAATEDGKQKHAVIEVPPMGFAWVEGAGADARTAKKTTPIAADNVLANEFLHVTIHPSTGGIRSIHDFIRRGNRMSQQLSLRMPNATKSAKVDPDEDAVYSVMAIDDLQITCSTGTLGEITTRGRLMHPEGRVVATYIQRYRLWHDSRVLWIDAELDPKEELRADPWNSYFASRFAWPNEGSELHRSVQHGRQKTDAKRIEAPLYVDIQEDNSRTSLLMGGLPYHRRIGLRMLDTLLLVKGESARKFRLGIGIDLPATLPAAQELVLPNTTLFQTAPPPTPVRSGWLFRSDAKNILATHWEPLVEDNRMVGFRARLLETEGTAGRVNLRCFRAVESARLLDFQNLPTGDLVATEDRIQLDFAAHEWVQVEARWKA